MQQKLYDEKSICKNQFLLDYFGEKSKANVAIVITAKMV